MTMNITHIIDVINYLFTKYERWSFLWTQLGLLHFDWGALSWRWKQLTNTTNQLSKNWFVSNEPCLEHFEDLHLEKLWLMPVQKVIYFLYLKTIYNNDVLCKVDLKLTKSLKKKFKNVRKCKKTSMIPVGRLTTSIWMYMSKNLLA